VAASQYGWMDYDLTQNQPVWNAFPEPIHFETMNIDPSEKYICFSAQQDYIFAETIHVCLDTRTRKIVEGINSSLWNQGTTLFRDYQKTSGFVPGWPPRLLLGICRRSRRIRRET
jgi:hypothetical protein